MPIAFLKHAIVRLPCDQWVTVANQKKKVFRFAARSQPRHRHNCILGSRLKAVHTGFPVCWRDFCKAFYRIHTETILYFNHFVGSTNTHIHTHTCSILGKNTDKGIPNAQSDRREIYYIILITWGKSEVFSLPKMKGIMVRSALLLSRY